MDTQEMRQLAADIVAGHVFTDRNIREGDEQMLVSIFLPIGLGGFSGERAEQTAMVYEYLSEAGPRSVNGYPTFLSMKTVSTDEWEEFHQILMACFDHQEQWQEGKVG